VGLARRRPLYASVTATVKPWCHAYMKYQIYQDERQQWRWRYVASNGRTIAISSQAYANKNDCLKSIAIMKASGTSPVEEI
jgi:uncharacterized protein